MSDTSLMDRPDTDASDSDTHALAEYIETRSSESREYNGSKCSPQKTMAVMLLSRAGRSQTAISQILGMDARTVKAILARQDSIIADGRMLLKANTLGFVGDAIVASQEAAKRGKLEGISAMLDRLGVTEPPKAQQATQVAVQVNLHGGPEPVSLAKVQQESESGQEQAHSGLGLISEPMLTVAIQPQPAPAQALTVDNHQAKVTQASEPAQDATCVAETRKQAEK